MIASRDFLLLRRLSAWGILLHPELQSNTELTLAGGERVKVLWTNPILGMVLIETQGRLYRVRIPTRTLGTLPYRDGGLLAVSAAPGYWQQRPTSIAPRMVSTLSRRGDHVLASAIAPNSRFVAIVASEGLVRRSHPRLRVHDLFTGREIWNSNLPYSDALEFSLDGSRLLVRTEGQLRDTVGVFETSTGRLLHSFPMDRATEAHFTANGQRVVCRSNLGDLKVEDIATQSRAPQWLVYYHDITAVGTSSGSPVFFTRFQLRKAPYLSSHIDLRNVETGREVARLRVGTSNIVQSDFTPDGQRLLVRISDGQLLLWELQPTVHEVPLTGLSGISLATFSPNGRQILSISNGIRLQIHNAETGARENSFDMSGESEITQLRYSPDGNFILALTNQGEIRIIDAHTLQTIQDFNPADQAHRSATFTPDGQHILVVNSEGQAQIWSWALHHWSQPDGTTP